MLLYTPHGRPLLDLTRASLALLSSPPSGLGVPWVGAIGSEGQDARRWAGPCEALGASQGPGFEPGALQPPQGLSSALGGSLGSLDRASAPEPCHSQARCRSFQTLRMALGSLRTARLDPAKEAKTQGGKGGKILRGKSRARAPPRETAVFPFPLSGLRGAKRA